MGLKGAGPYFQCSMSNKVLTGLVYHIFELYIDDVLIHGKDPEIFLANVRKVFETLREFNVAVSPKKTKLGLTITHGKDPETFLANVRKVFEFNITVNPKKITLGLAEVEYVGHVVS